MCVFSAPCALDVGHLHALGEAQGALGSFFLLALEFGGLRGPRSITAVCHPHRSPLFPSRAPASLQLISAPQTVVTTHHIMTQSRETEALPSPPTPPSGPARSPPSHLGLKLALRGATRRKCKANSFFLSGPPPLCLPPFVSLRPAVTFSPPPVPPPFTRSPEV